VDFNLHASTTSAETYFRRVQLAEELGYRGLYIGEGQLDILNPFQLIAAARFVSSDIHLGTATTNIVFRDPTLLAGEAGTANQMIGGRFVLGIATGDSAAYQLGRNITKIAEMEEATKTIRALLSGESLETPVGPVPLRFPVGDTVPPIYFAVEGPKGQRAAGRVADGVIMGNGFDLDVIETVRSRVAEGAEEVGRDPASVDLMAAGIIYVSDDGEDARTRARRRLANRAHHNFRLTLDSVPEEERPGVQRFMDNFDISRPLEDRVPAEFVSDYLVQRFAIAGTPAECIEQVEKVASIGISSFLLTPPEYAWEEVAQRWAEDVMPHLG
jgi:5,10-methylenetetrahydromethanopterin reductase